MSENNLSPNSDKQAEQPGKLAILWERIKRPSVFIATCLMAVIALFYLQDAKIEFAKKKIAPLIIVPEKSDPKVNSYLREGTQKELSDLLFVNVSKELIKNYPDLDESAKKALTDQLVDKFTPPGKQSVETTTAALGTQTKQQLLDVSNMPIVQDQKEKASKLVGLIELRQNLISNIVESTKYQTFKNDDELIIGLFLSLGTIKERDLKTINDSLSAAIKERINIPMQRDFAERLLEEFKAEQLEKSRQIVANPKNLSKQLKKFTDDNSYPFEIFSIWNVNQTLGRSSKQTTTVDGFGEVLNYLTRDRDKKTLSYEEIKNGITATYNEKTERVEARIEGIKKQAKATNEDFEPVYKSVYATLKNKDVLNSVFKPKDASPISKNIFDPENNLSVIYKILEYTLVAVIIFGLLYVILIPLKHIFFITTSTDSLNDHGKSFLQRADIAVAGANIRNSIILTATTIGIGAAVLAGTAISSSAENKAGDDSADAPEISMLGKNPNANVKPFKPADTADVFNTNIATQQIDVDKLALSVTALRGEFTALISELNKADIPNTVNSINENLKNIGDVVGTTNDEPKVDSPTLNGRTKALSASLQTRDGETIRQLAEITKQFQGFNDNDTLFHRVDKLNRGIGEVPDFTNQFASASASAPNSLLGAMGGVWRTLGTTRYIKTHATSGTNDLLQKLETIDRNLGDPNLKGTNSLFNNLVNVSAQINSVNTTLNTVNTNLGTHNSSDVNTLFGYTENIIGRRTNEIGRFIVGNDGNLFKQVRALFTGNRYVVNYFTVAELKTYNSTLKDNDLQEIIKAAEQIAEIINPSDDIPVQAPLSADDLFKLIKSKNNNITEKMWEKHKDLVLRSSRVARY